MKDLLNEDDFIKKRLYYNPGKVFGVFYAIAFLQLMLVCIIVGFYEDVFAPLALGALCIIIVFAMPFIMAFYGKNITASLQTIAIAVIILLAVYYFPFIILAFIGNASIDSIIICLILFCCNYAFCCAIILPIAKRIHKRLGITGN